MAGYAFIYFRGEWIQCDQNPMKYVGGSRKLVKILSGTTLEGFIQLLSEQCGIDSIQNHIQVCMKPKKIELDSPIKIENDEDVQGLVDMSQHLRECIPVFVTCIAIQEHEEKEKEEEEIGGNDDSEVKKKSTGKDLIDFHNDAFYIAAEWVRGDKKKVPDWGDFEGNEMIDVPFDETDFRDMLPVNYDINSLHLKDSIMGSENYSRAFSDNISTNPFKWLSKFSLQPSILSSDIKSIQEGNTVKLGDLFHDKKYLKDVVDQFALETGFQYRVVKSDIERWKIQCYDEKCKWFLSGRRVKPSQVFQIHKMNLAHICSTNQIKPHHRHVEAQPLGQLMKLKFVLIDHIYRPKEVIIDIADRYTIDISYSQVWRARNWALHSLKGSQEESFMLLPDYCYNLERANPGTVTAIETDNEHHFQYFFMALGCSIRVFKQYLRPVICIDAAFLKGRYLKYLFFAVALDGNNQIYPIAFGVGKKEDHETWCWFLTKLKNCINKIPELVIISDQHHAIYSAMDEVFPDVYHGCCCHHLLCNIRSKYKHNPQVACLYWKAAKSYTEADFETMMGSIDDVHFQAGVYLRDVGFDRWSRAHFSKHRYNIMTVNIAKSFNELVRHAQGLPITMLAEFIRGTLQRWFYERRNHANECSCYVTPWAKEKLEHHMLKAACFKVYQITNIRFQVIGSGGYKGVVDINEMTCTCKKFQLSRIPCKHFVAVAKNMRLTNVNA